MALNTLNIHIIAGLFKLKDMIQRKTHLDQSAMLTKSCRLSVTFYLYKMQVYNVRPKGIQILQFLITFPKYRIFLHQCHFFPILFKILFAS